MILSSRIFANFSLHNRSLCKRDVMFMNAETTRWKDNMIRINPDDSGNLVSVSGKFHKIPFTGYLGWEDTGKPGAVI